MRMPLRRTLVARRCWTALATRVALGVGAGRSDSSPPRGAGGEAQMYPWHMNHWVMKSEPDTFGFDDLRAEPGGKVRWDGVRNYEARNNLQACAPGDRVLFYHSNARPSGVVATAEVASEPYPDPTQFDAQHAGYDPESREDDPTWFVVDIRAGEPLPRKVPLREIKRDQALEGSMLARRGRLSVVPLTAEEYERILELARQDAAAGPT